MSGERGSTTAQLALVIPVFVLLLMCVIQFALALHGKHIAQAAASRALAAARTDGGSAAAGRAGADTVLSALGARVLTGPKVSVSRGAEYTVTRVTGTVTPLVPGLDLHVSGAASGPTDRFVAPPASPRR
jgi:Flp pilus assembly protein TadG